MSHLPGSPAVVTPAPGTPAPAAPTAPPAAPAAPGASAQPPATSPPATPAAAAAGQAPEAPGTPPAPKAPAPEAGNDGKPAGDVEYKLKVGNAKVLDEQYDVAEVVALAKKHKLAPEVAQAILDQRQGAITAFLEDHQELVKKDIAAWEQKWTSHPEFGGQQLPVSNQRVDAFLGKYADAELMAALQNDGWIKHPLFRALCARAGKGMEGDRFVPGNPSASSAQIKDPYKRLIAAHQADENNKR